MPDTTQRAATSTGLPDTKPIAEPTITELMEGLCELDEQNHERDETPEAGSLGDQACSEQLEAIMARLTGEMSELAKVRILPTAKALYETLHPQTKHGGNRGQVAKSATCPTFAAYVAGRTGLSKRTVYNRLETAEKLAALDPEAEEACFGTCLANNLGLLVRVAALPKPKLHRDLVTLFDRNRSAGKAELKKWEEEFEIGASGSTDDDDVSDGSGDPDDDEYDPESDEAEDGAEFGEKGEDTDSGEDWGWPGEPLDSSDADTILTQVMESLGVDEPKDCIASVRALQALMPALHEMEAKLNQTEAKAKALEKELALYRGTHLGELFGLLGAKTAKEALRKAREIVEASDAAE